MAVDESDVARIAATLSRERFAPYLRATGGDLHAAVRLYEWNLAASGALYEALGILEVVLRNALSVQLGVHHGALAGQWFDDPLGVLSDLAHDDIAAARNRVRKLRRPETPGRVVAELNFGFWKFLLAKRYEATLWRATYGSRSRTSSRRDEALCTRRWTRCTRSGIESPTMRRFAAET